MPLQTLANLFSPTFKPAFSDFSFSSDCVYVSTAASSWWKLDLCNISRLLVRWHWQFFSFELMPKFHKQSCQTPHVGHNCLPHLIFLVTFPFILIEHLTSSGWHILPTSSLYKWQSTTSLNLSVTFLHVSSLIGYDTAALAESAEHFLWRPTYDLA